MEVPAHLEFDVPGSRQRHARLDQLVLPEGVTLLDDLETVLAGVSPPAQEEEPSPTRTAAAGSRSRGRRARRGRRVGRRARRRRGLDRACGSGRGATAPRSTCSSPVSATRAASTHGNRHNVGWMVVDELARRHDGSWRAKFDGKLAEIRIDGHKVALLKPETYMNDSGRSVGAALRFFKLEPDSLLVVHDESDLESGRLQARRGGGLAGHNGLRSIAGRLGTPDFLRLRVGVGRPGRGDPRPSPTTSSPTSSHEDAEALVRRAADAVETLDAEGLDAAQRKVNEKR